MPPPSAPQFPPSLGGFDARRTPVLRTDVLVIGSGIAGASAALSAAEAGASVLLLSKTPLMETNTAYAQGGVAAVLGKDDDPELHLGDTLRVGAGLANPDVARQMIREGAEVVRWLVEVGAAFDRDQHGSLELSREGGHSVNRVVHAHGDATGREIQRALAAAIERHPNITMKVGPFVRDVLLHDGRCAGAVTTQDGVDLAIDAGAVVLATGGAGQIYRETTNPIGACGDGLALAFRAGAVLAGMEFVQFHPTTLYIAGAARFLISEVVRGAGATLRDRDGARFMPAVHPAAELAPRDVVSRAILERMVQTGDTHVYLDLSTVRGDPKELFPSIARILGAFDIDIAKDPIPVRPGAHYMVGGVECGSDGRTRVPGLFVAGEVAATGLHGANRLASNSLLEGVVLGRRAGPAAASFAARGNPSLPRVVAPPPLFENAPRIQHDDMLYSLKSLMWRQVGLIRREEGLTEARTRIGFWNRYLLRSRPSTRPACELANMLMVSALVTAAALERRESRGTHHRLDHPVRDDEQWCRTLRLELGAAGEIVCSRSERFAPSDKVPA